jgi:predicted metal-dependent peptidase
MTEIYGIMRAYKSKILVVEAETQVDHVYELKPNQRMNNKFIGRCGGTFVPVFDYFDNKRRKKPDVLVYFTDGYEEYPKETRIKTVWVRPSACAGDGFQGVPFGQLIQIPAKKDQPRRGW